MADGKKADIMLLAHDYNNVQFLNDFNHLLFNHVNQFEDIYNNLIETINNNKECEMSKCLILRRNHRNRKKFDRKMYFQNENNIDRIHVVQQQMIDRVHSYFFHSFDIGYKLQVNELPIIETNNVDDGNTKNNYDPAFNRLVTFKRGLYRNRSGIRAAGLNNKFMITADNKPNELNEYSYG
eukprot:200223_1